MTQARQPNEPMTEEQILAAHIGEKRPHNDTVHLAEYDPPGPVSSLDMRRESAGHSAIAH
jgi:hypothetical protein